MRHWTLRAIYALHMIVPAAVMLWHVDRLDDDTARALLALFTG